MKKSFLYLIISSMLVFFSSKTTFAQSESTYNGHLDLGGQKLELMLTLEKVEDEWKAYIDIPQQGAKKLPANQTFFENNQLKAQWSNFGFSFEGNMPNPDRIEGKFMQGGNTLPLILEKNNQSKATNKKIQTPIPSFPYSVEEVTFINRIDQNKLAGTLTLPTNANPNTPVVILISGSGQQDRNSTLYDHEPFWVLADYLTRNGIGVLRYDDRGMGNSEIGPDITKVTSENFKQDAIAALQLLRDKGFKKIGLIGHSEGGMIAQMIAASDASIAFSVYMAGPGISGANILIGQSYEGAIALGADQKGASLNQQLVKAGVKAVLSNKDSAGIYSEVYNTLKSMEEFANTDSDVLNQTTLQVIRPLLTPWMKYFIRYNPSDYIPKIKSPILALFGSKDFQVIASENHLGMSQLLDHKNPKHKSQILPNLNHLFQPSHTGSLEEYSSNIFTLDPVVLNTIKDWIHQSMK